MTQSPNIPPPSAAAPGQGLDGAAAVTAATGEVHTAKTLEDTKGPTEKEILRVENLTVEFPTDDGVVRAVRDVSYSLREREVLSIVGESGSGKSVSSMALLGLLPRSARVSGKVLYRGQDLLAMRQKDLRSLRGRKISMIFQDPMTALNPVHTVGDQLAEAVLAHELVPPKHALERAREMLDLVGIPQAGQRLRSYPHEFSGGMRQRVMIAMAIINNPDVIIADEPTTALDVTVQAQILEKLLEVKDAVNSAILLITHDLGVVAGLAHRVLVMYAGRPVEIGATDDVFYRTRMPYTAGLLGSIPSMTSAHGERLRPIKGTPPSLINLPEGCPFSPRCPLADDTCRSAEPPLAPANGASRGAEGTEVIETADGVRIGEHLAACHHWERLAAAEDPTAFFRNGGITP
ncbi:ABC transporter ATP-binding protein [Nocardiopsis metallicus]|uniref:Peptide/nickel transport system ATP-binding protein n=1 Tax=Nocardiopsis metallicus TaxID=179819 RepID=A0A840WHL1_9ACTN|nr:ABC transporter ATP-binding protein [Nocardiopsis metallicus]MBB5489558.1 peptide/nickel transport system ATP-binding protein [Nocardiopsis metallicus]